MSINTLKYSKLANSTNNFTITDILNLTLSSDIISFAYGLPASDSFPIDKIAHTVNEIMHSDKAIEALQYGQTEGYTPLRDWIANDINKKENLELTADNVLIVSGSQQSLDLIAKALINSNDHILVESPTYLGVLEAFLQYFPQCIKVNVDDNGLNTNEINDELAQKSKFLYIVPNFQNPTGRQLSLERRKKLAQIAIKNDLIIIEDDPYGALDYSGKHIPSLIILAPNQVIYLGSFSKILSPGLRVGYIIGDTQLIKKLILLKQATDIQTSTFTQMITYEVIKDGFLDTQIPKIREIYHKKCVFMLRQLENYMPKSVNWTAPQGGMFIWLTLPKHIDSLALLQLSIKNNVAFVPGVTFYASSPARNTLRLSFVTVNEDQIELGIKILAELISCL